MICEHEIRIRGRRSGDRLRLSGGSKSLKALMIDRKLPAALRPAVPVLTLDGQPVAVFGVGADPACLAVPGEDALVIAWEPEAIQLPDGADGKAPRQNSDPGPRSR